MKPTLVIICFDNRLAAWYLAALSPPKRLKVQGQDCLDLSTPQALASAYADLTERLQDEAIGQIHWLLDQRGQALWTEWLPLREDFPGSPLWQVLAWEWLAERFGLSGVIPWAVSDFLESELLPWLLAADDAAERQQMKDALAREHDSESDRLATERVKLQHENMVLREQNAALRQVDTERLLTYLPAIFPRVFTILGAADLAQLCGRVEPLAIPNPYPEPSEETLRILQKHFIALPHNLQRQIVSFVARLPQRQKLTVRPEMRELMHELERS